VVAGSELAAAFTGLPPYILDRIAALSIRCRFRPRQAVFRAGDGPDGLYVVLTGRVRVSRETAHHVELLHMESDGGVLGELPIFGGGAFPATAIAVAPTECAKIPKAAVERLLREHPEFTRFALARLAIRAQGFLRRIDELTATTITARIARHLLLRARKDSELTLGMSQAALADDLGTAREVVVRAIAALVHSGSVRRAGRSRYEIVDEAALRVIASG
jgi:CRP/FNR family transcriptional regulator